MTTDRPLTYEDDFPGPRFEMRQVYGRPLAYPTDALADVFCRLVGHATLTPAQVKIIRDELGYAVVLETPSLEVPSDRAELDLTAIEARSRRERTRRTTAEQAEAEVARLKARLEKAEAVCEAVDAVTSARVAGETYCDVGAPDDCDHCVIETVMEAWRAAKGEGAD